MGGGVSRGHGHTPREQAPMNGTPPAASESPSHAVPAQEPRKASIAPQEKIQTSIDSRIVETLRKLNLARKEAPEKAKTLNFARIVLKFGMAHAAFDTIHEIYDEYAAEDGLDFDGLKRVLNALGAEMQEQDMREIFYESDMVRDNSLSRNEFVVSLAISYLLGLIKTFNQLTHSIVHTPEGVKLTPKDELSARESIAEPGVSSPEMIAKALELMVTAYMLFDNDASGTIQISEVRDIMAKHNEAPKRKLERKSSGMTTKAIRNERIKELDLDSDGTITFQEFVLTFQKWVGVEE